MDAPKDRALLELAAKACGLPECGWMGPAFMYVKDGTFTDWNPLTDDGDALRLAVKLGFQVFCPDAEPSAVVRWYPWDDKHRREECAGIQDPYAATRRAIVRAAAAIGEQHG